MKLEVVLTTEDIARVGHEANRAYCMTIGDYSQPTWDMAPQWQKSSIIERVEKILDDPDTSPEDNHEKWRAIKEAQGWKHGPVKAPEKKEHPCMMPYSDLPKSQQVKSWLFLGVVTALQPATLEAQKGLPLPELMEDEPTPEPSTPSKRKGDDTLDLSIVTEDDELVQDDEMEFKGKRKKKNRKKKT